MNIDQLARIAADAGVPVQYGGGLRSPAAVDDALDAGAARVILGTAAFTTRGPARAVLAAHGPERVLVSVDVRGGHGDHGRLDGDDRR